MKTRNETTSRKSASAAGKILANSRGLPGNYIVIALRADAALGVMELMSCLNGPEYPNGNTVRLCTVDELQSAVASDLVQRVKGKK